MKFIAIFITYTLIIQNIDWQLGGMNTDTKTMPVLNSCLVAFSI
jgi:hypothetical protein